MIILVCVESSWCMYIIFFVKSFFHETFSWNWFFTAFIREIVFSRKILVLYHHFLTRRMTMTILYYYNYYWVLHCRARLSHYSYSYYYYVQIITLIYKFTKKNLMCRYNIVYIYFMIQTTIFSECSVIGWR